MSAVQQRDKYKRTGPLSKLWKGGSKATKMAWRLRNPDRVKELSRQHSTQHQESAKDWALRNPQKYKAIMARHAAKRRLLGFNPLNSPFPGSEPHHINPQDVIYIPRKLHHSVYHRQDTGQGMAAMNTLAGQYLTEDWT